jgi:MoxR-like ATPase
MFNILVKYPSFQEELSIIEGTTGSISKKVEKVISAQEIIYFQDLIRKTPISSNVVEYAVKLAVQTRPNESMATENIKKYISWGAGPRASQFLVIGAKCNALLNGKYSPDIEDVKAVAKPILRHRVVKNYVAEADGMSVDGIIDNLL